MFLKLLIFIFMIFLFVFFIVVVRFALNVEIIQRKLYLFNFIKEMFKREKWYNICNDL